MISFTRMVIPEAKDWVGILALTASALAGITALAVSLWVAHAQRQLTQRQIKQALYEKRYAVFLATEEFLMHLLRVNGSLKLPSEEFRNFHYAVEQAEFLFQSDVAEYLTQLRETALDLHPKTFERDHLAAMNQQKPELDSEITKALMEIGGPFIEMRKKVFGPYLQLGPPAMEGSKTMRLNGWQRLWILLTVLWLIPVGFFTYEFGPSPTFVPKGDVYARMKGDDGGRLIDFWDVVFAQLGGTNGTDSPLVTKLQQDKEFLAASPKDQKAYLATVDADFKKASPNNQNAYLGHIAHRTGPTVDIDGSTVQFVADLSQEDMDQTVQAYHKVVREILTNKREILLGRGLAFWLIPAIALYALGWGFAWVRRGFYRST